MVAQIEAHKANVQQEYGCIRKCCVRVTTLAGAVSGAVIVTWVAVRGTTVCRTATLYGIEYFANTNSHHQVGLAIMGGLSGVGSCVLLSSLLGAIGGGIVSSMIADVVFRRIL